MAHQVSFKSTQQACCPSAATACGCRLLRRDQTGLLKGSRLSTRGRPRWLSERGTSRISATPCKLAMLSCSTSNSSCRLAASSTAAVHLPPSVTVCLHQPGAAVIGVAFGSAGKMLTAQAHAATQIAFLSYRCASSSLT